MNLIILAAGRGTRLQPLTEDLPKCMVELAGRPLLYWQIEMARAAGVDNIIVVRGYRGDKIRHSGVTYVENPSYESTNMVVTLLCARAYYSDGFIMSYGDILYNPDVLKKLMSTDDEIAVIVDKEWRSYWQERVANVLDDAESLVMDEEGYVQSIGEKVQDFGRIHAQYIGMVAFRRSGVAAMVEILEREREAAANGNRIISADRDLNKLYMTDVIQGLIKEGTPVRGVPIHGGWLEIDTTADLALAKEYCRIQGGTIRIER